MARDGRQIMFEVTSDDDGGQVGTFLFPTTETWKFCEEKFDLALDNSGDPEEYAEALLQILELEPFFLDGYAHLGNLFLDNDYVGEAERWYSKGLGQVRQILPKNYSGLIQWMHFENRPFLRLHHGLILCQLRKEKFGKAVKLLEEHLAWNPNDNIGVRFLIGDACFRGSMFQKAGKYLKDIKDEYPPAAYSLALLEFKKEKYIEAATTLRLGMATNYYIAEGLTGRVDLSPHLHWDYGPHSNHAVAEEYIDHGGYDMWEAVDGAIAFCDWLFNCSEVLLERAEVMAALEGLTREHDSEIRGVYVDKLQACMSSIDSRLSKEIVKKFVDRSGIEIWPWEYRGASWDLL